MITQERLEEIARDLPKVQPTNFLKLVNDSNAGIGLALKLLASERDKQLSAGRLSEAMGISTARVAVLLKKMEQKGLIVKAADETDARVTLVKLSDEGVRLTNEMHENMLRRLANVIDQVGEETFLRFVELSNVIKEAMNEEFLPKPIL